MVCLNHDGNVIDAAVKASVAALRNLTLPAVVIESDEDNAVAEDVIKVDASDRSPLRLGAQVTKTLDGARNFAILFLIFSFSVWLIIISFLCQLQPFLPFTVTIPHHTAAPQPPHIPQLFTCSFPAAPTNHHPLQTLTGEGGKG